MLCALKLAKHFLITQVLLVLTLIVFASSAAIAATGMTYHGRIIKPNGEPLEAATVFFQIQIRSPNTDNCLLFDEQQTLNMSGSAGIFVLTIGEGTRVLPAVDGGYAISRLFANRGTMNGLNCSFGNSYSPAVADGRKLQVQFNDGSGWQLLPPQNINYVPLAIEAVQISGYSKDQLLRVADGVVATEFSSANWLALWDLITGASSVYSKTDGSNFNPSSDVGFNNKKAVNLADPVGLQDAATKNYVDGSVGGKTADVTGVSSLAGDGKSLVWDQAQNKWVTGIPNDTTKLSLSGGTMTGAILMSGYSVSNVGHVVIADQGTLYLGKFDSTQESALLPLNNTTDRGRTWFNVDTGKMRYWDGGAAHDVPSKGYVDTAVSAAGTAANTYADGVGAAAVASAKTYADGKLVSKDLSVPVAGNDQQSIRWNEGSGVWEYFTPSSSDATKLPLAGGTMSGNIIMGGNLITGLGAPSLGGDAVNKTYADSKVSLAGDTMSGLLILSADPSAALGAATKQYVDAVSSAAAGAYVRIDGTIALSADWDLNGATAGGTRKLTGLADPTVGDGAATKTYVDAREAAAVATANTYSDGKLVSKNLAVPGVGQDGQSIRWNNTSDDWEYFTPSTGSVTGVTSANTDIGVGGTAAAPVLTLNSGTGNNQIVKLNASAELPAVSGVNLTALNASNIASGTLADARLSANVALKSYTDANILGLPLAAPAGAQVGQAIRWNAGGTAWEYFTPSTGTVTNIATGTGLSGGPITGTGTISIAAGGVSATELASNAVTTVKVLDANVTYAKIQNVSSNNRLLGRATAGAGVLEEITLGTGLSLTGSTLNAAGSGGTVTEVTSANSDASFATTTTTPVLTINTGVGNNQILKLNGSAQIPAVDGSLLTSLNGSSIASGTVADARLSSNVALKNLKLDQFAATTSAELAGVLSDETGSAAGGLAVFSNSPVVTTPSLKGFSLSGATSGEVNFSVAATGAAGSYVWPVALPGSNMVLQSDNTGALSWVAQTSGNVGDFLKDGTVAMTGQLQALAGSAAAPGITFDGDEDTGFHNYSDGSVAFSGNGTDRVRFTSAGNIQSASGAFAIHAASSAATPTYGFAASAGSGMFRPAADTVGFSTDSAERLRILPAGGIRLAPSALPGTPAAGDIAFDSGSSNAFKIHNGTAWRTMLPLEGGTMTGILTLSADPSNAMEAATKQYVDAVTTASAAAYIKKDGTTPFTGSQSMGGNTLYGNSTASGILTLESTSNATKGNIVLNPTGGNVGIGTTTPAAALSVTGGAATTSFTSAFSSAGGYPVANAKSTTITVTGNDGVSQLGSSYETLNFSAAAARSQGTAIVNQSSLSIPANLTFNNASAGNFGASASGGNATTLTGISGSASRNSASGITTNIRGGSFSSFNSNSTVTNGYGVYASSAAQTIGTVTNLHGIYATAVVTTGATSGAAYGGRFAVTNTGTLTAGYGVYIDDTQGTTQYGLYQAGSNDLNYFAGNVGIGTSTPTATLQLKAGTAAANTAPLKLTSGVNLTAPEAGAIEYDGTNLYFTDGGATRRTVATVGGSSYGDGSTIKASAGTNAAPSLAFNGDPDTGFYNTAADTISIAANGAKIFDLSAAGLVSPTTGGANVTTAAGTAAAPTYSFAGDAGTGWFRPAASTMAASTGGVERMRIDSSGNVGIGTVTPSYKLAVDGQASVVERLHLRDLNSTPAQFDAATLDSYVYNSTPGGESSGLAIKTKIGGAENYVADFSDNFYLYVPLDVDASSSAFGRHTNDSLSHNFNFYKSRNGAGVQASDDLFFIAAYGKQSDNTWSNSPAVSISSSTTQTHTSAAHGASISFATTENNTASRATRMTIDHNGYIGIGTTTPAAKLDVQGQARTKSHSQATGAIDWDNGNAITTSFDCGSNISFANLLDGGSYTLAVTGTGTTQCSFNTAVTGSDAATVNYRFNPANGVRSASTHSIYSLQRIGTTVYVSWISGF